MGSIGSSLEGTATAEVSFDWVIFGCTKIRPNQATSGPVFAQASLNLILFLCFKTQASRDKTIFNSFETQNEIMWLSASVSGAISSSEGEWE